MAVIFQDNFVEAADTNLTAHTPNTGTAWVQVAITGTAVIKIFGATDDISGSASASGNGQYLKSTPAPATADVDVSITCSTIDGGSTNARKVRLHARGNGVNDYYAVRFSPPGAAVNDVELVKVVGGVLTSLGSVDTGITNGDVFVLKIRDAAKEVLKNGVSILSSADNAITAAGDCGISMGQVSAGDTGNIAGAWRWDDYSVTEVTGGTTYTEAGEGDSALTASADDAATFVDAGQAASAGAASGADVLIVAEGTQATSTATIGAEDVLIVVEAGQATSGTAASGADAWTMEDAGQALAAWSSGALDTIVMVDAGDGVLAAIASGSDSGAAAPADLPYAGDLTIYDSAGGAGAIGSGAAQPPPTAASATGSTSGATILPSEATYG